MVGGGDLFGGLSRPEGEGHRGVWFFSFFFGTCFVSGGGEKEEGEAVQENRDAVGAAEERQKEGEGERRGEAGGEKVKRSETKVATEEGSGGKDSTWKRGRERSEAQQ